MGAVKTPCPINTILDTGGLGSTYFASLLEQLVYSKNPSEEARHIFQAGMPSLVHRTSFHTADSPGMQAFVIKVAMVNNF